MNNTRHMHHHGIRHTDGLTYQSFDEYQLFVGNDRSNHDRESHAAMDIAFGRAGNDHLSGGGMGDDLMGGAGNDQLAGSAGADHLVGGSGNDRLTGGSEADTLMGEDGNDYLNEGAGHGDIDGGLGNDILVGGLGADAFMIAPDSGHDIIKDFVAGPGIFDHLAVMDIEPEQLRLHDTAAGVLIGWNTDKGDGSVLLEGVYKDDLYQNDFMFADDRHLINPTDPTADRVTAEHFVKDGGNEASPATPGQTAAQFQTSFDDNHVAFGTDAQSDTLQATDKNDFYFGLGGDDQLHGGDGRDHLAGDAGNDLLDGGNAQDDLRGGAGDDKLYGGLMNDNLMGEDGKDYLSAGAGHDMLDGGPGNDVYNGGDGADAFIVAHGSGNDVVVGGFDAGPGAFDHIAFSDVLPNEVTVADSFSTHGDDHTGVLVSWGDGSLFLEDLTKAQMTQDDFMFNAVEGGAFVPDPQISTGGSSPIFQGPHPEWQMA